MYEFKKFDIEKIINKSILIIGRSATGKTTLIKDFIHGNLQRYKTNNNLVFATSIGRGYDVGKYLDDHIIKENYISTEYNGNKINEHITKKDKENTYIILDGVIHNNKIFETDISLQKIQYNCRQYYITSIITQQYPLQMTPEYRENFDFIILFDVGMISSVKKIYEYYGGPFPSFDIFYKFFKEFTSDHGCMIIDNTVKHINNSDFIYWYKVDINKYDKSKNKITQQNILYSKL